MDRISNLPENLIGLILEKLPLIDRVKTSSLSSSWKYKWTFLSSLNLDDDLYNLVHRRSKETLIKYATQEYVIIINSLVLQQRGQLKELSLFVCPTDLSYEHLISYVARSANLMRLCLRGHNHSCLPSSTFTFANLTQLELSQVCFSTPYRFKGFPNLTHFRLYRVCSITDVISHFVSVCPQLEQIGLENLHLVDKEDIALNAPKLTCLLIEGYITVSISNAEYLESVSMWIRCSALAGSVLDLYNKSSTQLQHVSLNGCLCKILGSCSAIQMLLQFDRLKSLEFREISLDDPDEILCFLSFFKCSPNVRKIQLEMKWYNCSQAAKPLLLETMAEKYIDDDLGALTRVDLYGFSNSKIEMKIIELLLRHSPVLKVMYIGFHREASENTKFQILEHMINFDRAAPKAKIYFT